MTIRVLEATSSSQTILVQLINLLQTTIKANDISIPCCNDALFLGLAREVLLGAFGGQHLVAVIFYQKHFERPLHLDRPCLYVDYFIHILNLHIKIAVLRLHMTA